MNAALEVRTDRLLLRQWRTDDFNPFAAFYADPALARFVGGQATRDSAWRRMATLIGHWALRGYGYWAVEERGTGRFAGAVGLWYSDGWPEPELGYWLVPAMRGKGYATEAAGRARDHAFDTVGLKTLVSYIDPANDPSRQVAERLGARCESTIDLLEFGPHRVYRHPAPRAGAAPAPAERNAR